LCLCLCLCLRVWFRHIDAFGGDPQRLMLAGESAGATTTLLHLIAPGSGAGRLFTSAALQSTP
jgi:carboxylesterase type B